MKLLRSSDTVEFIAENDFERECIAFLDSIRGRAIIDIHQLPEDHSWPPDARKCNLTIKGKPDTWT